MYHIIIKDKTNEKSREGCFALNSIGSDDFGNMYFEFKDEEIAKIFYNAFDKNKKIAPL